jgi:hypothetical protein
MIEARVDQLQAHHRHADDLGDLGVRSRVGAESAASQHHRAHDQQVALSLVEVTGEHRLAAEVGHPRGVRVGFPCALGVFESGHDGGAVHQQAAVGGVHHVG